MLPIRRPARRIEVLRTGNAAQLFGYHIQHADIKYIVGSGEKRSTPKDDLLAIRGPMSIDLIVFFRIQFLWRSALGRDYKRLPRLAAFRVRINDLRTVRGPMWQPGFDRRKRELQAICSICMAPPQFIVRSRNI